MLRVALLIVTLFVTGCGDFKVPGAATDSEPKESDTVDGGETEGGETEGGETEGGETEGGETEGGETEGGETEGGETEGGDTNADRPAVCYTQDELDAMEDSLPSPYAARYLREASACRSKANNLLWYRSETDKLSWSEANAACAGLIVDTAGGWRLPTVAELQQETTLTALSNLFDPPGAGFATLSSLSQGGGTAHQFLSSELSGDNAKAVTMGTGYVNAPGTVSLVPKETDNSSLKRWFACVKE